MKNICFVVPNFPTLSETFITNQIVALKKQGYKVFVLCHTKNELNQSNQKELLKKYDILKDLIEIDYKIPKFNFLRIIKGILPIIKYFDYWLRTPTMSLKHRFSNLPYLLSFYGNLRHVDVFHIQFANAGMGVAKMKENGLLQGKVITTFHGHDAQYRDELELEKLRIRHKILFKVSEYITVNTNYLKKKVIELECPEEKIKIIPMGINLDFFKSNLRKSISGNETVRLISIGRHISLKGFLFAIETIKILVDKGFHINYTIIGSGPLKKKLEEKICNLKIESNVTLMENKSQVQIRDLLDSHHIYLMCSITDSKGRAEAQGLVTAEAQAMGLPVVAFDSGGVPDTIQDGKTGFLISEKDVESYASAIIGLITNTQLYERMSNQAKLFAESTFKQEMMTERFIRLYEFEP